MLEWAHNKGEQDRAAGIYRNPSRLAGPFRWERQAEIAAAYDRGWSNTDRQIREG
jgi:hypothetical protein